jgi:hypothetical protein
MLHKESILPRNDSVGCYCGGVVNWRTAIIHYVAKAVGLHVKIEGFPLGTSRNLDRQSVDAGPTSLGAFSQIGSGGVGNLRS